MNAPRTSKTWLHVAFGAYCVAAFAALTWPVYPALGNRVRPLICGLPFSLAWIVGWIVATFVVLIAYDWAANRD